MNTIPSIPAPATAEQCLGPLMVDIDDDVELPIHEVMRLLEPAFLSELLADLAQEEAE